MAYYPGRPYNLLEVIRQADAGNREAMKDFIIITDVEGLVSDDESGDIRRRRLRYMQLLAEDENYPEMVIMLAGCYERGDGVPRDSAEAIRLYELAVEKGIRFGNECIGLMYCEGHGIPVDYEKAYAYFTKDDTRKSFCTLYSLGEMYRLGQFVERSAEKALEYYEAIAYDDSDTAALDSYYGPACYRTAIACHYGQGTEVDLEAALENMEDARKYYSESFYRGLHITKRQMDTEWIRLNRDAGRFS